MKGLNCYAGFWDVPGIEKILNPNPGKSSFLRPVTPRLPHRRPSLGLAVDGLGLSKAFPDGTFLPSTVVFFVLLFPISGRTRLPDSHPHVPNRAGLSLLQRLTFLLKRFCSFVGDVRACTLTGKPFFSSVPYIFYRTVGPTLPRGLPFFRTTW